MNAAEHAVSIVVPVFNNWRLTQRSLAAIRATTRPGILRDIIVVDDGSTDATVTQMLAQPDCTLLRLGQNRGFATACNAGAHVARAPFVLFLNNDAFPHEGAIEAMLDAMAQADVGVVGAKLLYSDGTLQHAGVYVHERGEPFHAHWHAPGDVPDANVARDYPSVTGAAMLVRKALFERLGGFDPAYRTGYEDTDFSLRVWQSGYRVRYEPAAVMTHLEGSSRASNDGEEENRRLFFERWRPLIAQLPQVPRPDAPGMAIAGDLGGNTVSAYVGRVFFMWLHKMGIPSRWLPAQAPPPAIAQSLAPLLNARREFYLFCDWLEGSAQSLPGGRRVTVAAPKNAAEARVLAAVAADLFLVPTRHAMGLLAQAGADPLRLLHLGFGIETKAYDPRRNPQRAGVCAMLTEHTSDAAIALVAEIAAAAQLPALTFVTHYPHEEAVPRIGAVIARSAAASAQMSVRVVVTEPLQVSAFEAHAALLVVEAPDPFCAAVLAAMSAGTLVTTLRVAPVDEFVNDATALVRDDPASLATALREALEHPERTAHLRDEAAFDARRRFDYFLSVRHANAALRSLVFGPDQAALGAITPEARAGIQAYRYT